MFVAESDAYRRVFHGAEFRPERNQRHRRILEDGLRCPICRQEVTYNGLTNDRFFQVFRHSDGSADCFEVKSRISDEHRIAVEIAVMDIYNRISEITGILPDLDVERWVGDSPNFIISDIKVESPLKIVVEIFYKAARLALYRRLSTIFSNDYRAYLVFHSGGRHETDRVEKHLQQIAPVAVGRFDAETFEITLGDLFSEERIEFSDSIRQQLPNYITM